MEHPDDDIYVIITGDTAPVTESGDRLQFFFDDEPLQSILYGEPTEGPTQANLYLPIRERVEKILIAYKDGYIQEAIQQAALLASSGSDISIGMYCEITEIMRSIVPDYTKAIIKYDLTPLQLLLEQIWRQSLEVKDKGLQKSVGTPLYRWYEHHEKYHDARMILRKLIRIYREEKSQTMEAILTNNLAFEYWLEGKKDDAVKWFKTAELIFQKDHDTFNVANSRVNYLMCKFDLNDLDDTEEIESELKELAKMLSSSGLWHERKPWILLAKLEERRGKIEEAINLVKRAIESSKDSNTWYSKQDEVYLKQLEIEKT